MKDYNIFSAPLTFLSIQEIQMKEEVNEHGTMTITGFIEDRLSEF